MSVEKKNTKVVTPTNQNWSKHLDERKLPVTCSKRGKSRASFVKKLARDF